MTQPRPTDLSPEERTLAEQLARVGPRMEPSAALDARVLSAARAASEPTVQPARPPRRWPVAMGLVASLALVVGIAWRVRPLPSGPPSGVPESARPATAMAPAQAQRNATMTMPATGVSDTTSPAGESPPQREASTPPTASRAKTATPPALTPDIEPDVPTPVEAPPAPRSEPAPPPPQARPSSQSPSAPVPEPSANAATDAARVQSNAASDASAATAEALPEQGSVDEPMDAMPPATADAPGVRDAWLLRIRDLIDSGDIAGGRRSLRAFAQRYPDYPLPEDLRALLR